MEAAIAYDTGTQLLVMQPTNTVVERPTSDDVLFGRHAQSWNHEGNRRFRSIVSKYQDAYHSAKVRIKKVAIVAKIVNEVRQNGARFLRRDKQLSKWYEVDRKACIEKVRLSDIFCYSCG